MLPLIERFEAKYVPEPNTGCWLWIAGTKVPNGYGCIHVGSRSDGTNRMDQAHRVAHELFVGPIPEGLCVLHRCDTMACVNPAHLFLGTKLDNAHDRELKGRGRQPCGIDNHSTKLGEGAHQRIAQLRAGGLSQQAIADILGVTQVRISQILRGYRHPPRWTGTPLSRAS